MSHIITTAIDYVNSLPHIGTAYEKIGADVWARFQTLLGHKTELHMGNDEHSANVQKSAEAKGLAPKVYCDDMRPKFEDVWRRLNIDYSDFIQTSEVRHHKAVLAFFERVHKNGDIYQKDYEGWYCESCEAFLTDKDLIDGKCPNHKSVPKWLKEQNYFFNLKKYEQSLIAHIEANPHFVMPAKRRNEVLQFLRQGLEDISISRSTFSWGIPLPHDPKHVFYVWFDALINYATMQKFGTDDAAFEKSWPGNVHIVGKDITRFHCIIWPAMLMSAKLPLPKMVFGHGFVYLRGEKMSKSLGNVVTPLDILTKFPDFGADALRYYLMRTSSFGDDADFTWEGFIERYNADLANGIGNLASRILGMVWKYQAGKVSSQLDLSDQAVAELLGTLPDTFKRVQAQMNPLESGDINSHLALEIIWGYISKIDQMIDSLAPWTLAKKGETERLSQVLSLLTESVAHVTVLVSPFIPNAAEKIWKAYGFDKVANLATVKAPEFFTKHFLTQPHQLMASKLNLFPRIDEVPMTTSPDTKSTESTPSSSLQTPHSQLLTPNSPHPQLIDIDHFKQIDLRIAKVLEAAAVPKADKLLQLKIEVGSETRTIISGIAQHYKPEDLVGKSVVIVANLKPAKIRGIESFGMLIAAKDGEQLVLVSPEAQIASGAKVG